MLEVLEVFNVFFSFFFLISLKINVMWSGIVILLEDIIYVGKYKFDVIKLIIEVDYIYENVVF